MRILGNNDFTSSFSSLESNPLIVYIKQVQCSACVNFNPVFVALEQKRRMYKFPDSLQFATIVYSGDLAKKIDEYNRIQKSMQDAVELIVDRTPTLIIFYETMPVAKYSGQCSENAVATFIHSVFKNEIAELQNQHTPQQSQYGSYGIRTMAPPMQLNTILPPPSFSQFQKQQKIDGVLYNDEYPSHFDQPQYNNQPPIWAPVTWRNKNVSGVDRYK
jgi:hypothetical protein